MKKKRLKQKINHFLKKNLKILTLIAFIFTLAGVILNFFEHLTFYATGCFILATIIAGTPILYRALMALKQKVISIELLVSIAVIGALCIKEFSECAMVTFLFQFGAILEQKTLEKTRGAIKELVNMAPKTANRVTDDGVMTINASSVQAADILLVKEGEMVASDGLITSGDGYFVEASITGEALPKYKTVGQFVYAGTLLEKGYVKMQATRVGDDTTFGKIITLVEEAADTKSPLDRFINRFARYYTPIVILLALITLFALRLIKGYYDIDTAITVLVLACPGALVIGSPIANVSGVGRGAKNHVLLKGGDSIYEYAKTDIFLFDKTGTLTKGMPEVLNHTYYGTNFNQDLSAVASFEKASLHPLGKAIWRYALAQGLSIDDLAVTTFKGLGLLGQSEESQYIIGNELFLKKQGVNIDLKLQTVINNYKSHGSSIILVAKDKKLLFVFEIGDEIKPDAPAMLKKLKALGIKQIIMLTGDSKEAAEYTCNELKITEYYAELLPEEKLAIIKKLKDQGKKVTFVGDGINDTPSLALADTSIAMGNGTDIAIETSSVVLMQSTLTDLVFSFELSRKTVIIAYQNVAIALLTVFLLLLGLFLNYIHLSVGMLIHEISILVVILNAMRLLVWRKK